MSNTNRKIDDFIDDKLRGSKLSFTSGDFKVHLMKRLAAEHKAAIEESKWDKLVKYIIGSFSFGIIALTVTLGILSGSSSGVTSQGTGVNFGPAVETSNNYLERFFGFFQNVFVGILNFLGFSARPKTFTILLIAVLVIAVFLAAERFVLRGRLRSSSISIK